MMIRLDRLCLAALLAAGCSAGVQEGAQEAPAAATLRSPALGMLMKNEINPPFSKLSFLLNHLEEDAMPEEAQFFAELEEETAALREAIGRLRDWSDPPVASAEGREVFHSYALNLDRMSGWMAGALEAKDRGHAQDVLGRIAATCNSCHHFFRLELVEQHGGEGEDGLPKDESRNEGDRVVR